MDLGFDPRHVLNVTLDPQENNYNEAQTKEFYRELESKIKALPGIESASLASSVPITSFPSKQRVFVEGQHLPPDHLPSPILFDRVDADYFKTMDMPLLRGRGFSESDGEAAPLVAIVNQTMASRLWPREAPIGKRFSVEGESGPFMEVVGIVKDSKYQTVAEDPQPYFYVPMAQDYVSSQILQVRSSIAPRALISQIQQEIRALDPAMTIVDMRTMKESLEGGTGFFIFRLGASLAAMMGTLGLILAIVGVYGIVSYAAIQRTREIGIRMALGANTLQVLGLIIGQGMRLVLAGILAGLLAAWLLTRTMTHMLIGISASDPVVYIGVSVLLSFVALLACWLPARRAAKVDPMVALRYE
jgi:predicted permease